MRFDNKDIGLFSDEAPENNKPKNNKPKKKKLNEGFSWLLTAAAVYSFYKFIQGLRRKGEPSEAAKNYGKSNWSSLNSYVKDYLKQGGKIQYEENYWFHVFEVGDLIIKIDKQNKTVFWTHIVPDIKRFLKYKTDKRIEFTDIGYDEHEYTIPIPISQSDIDSLVDAIKQDLGESKETKTKKKIKISESQFKRLFKEDYYESRKPVDGYVDGDDLVGQHLWVHTNRTHRNNGWNGMIGIYASSKKGRKTGTPLFYTNEIRLQSPIYFQTSEKGAKGIKQTGKRTLIAGVSGIVVPTEGTLSGFEEISYSPFESGYFYRLGDEEKREIVGASEIYFKSTEDGHWFILAKDIEYKGDIIDEQDDTGGSSAPSDGGSVWSSGASSYTGIGRGKANPIGNTKWESGVTRGPANPL